MPNQIFGHLAQDWALSSLDSVGSERHFLRKKRWMPFECAEYGLEFTFRERDDLLDRRFGDPCFRNIVGSDELLSFERREKCPYPSGIGVDGGLADHACCTVYGGMTLPCRALLEVEYKFPEVVSGHRRKIRVSIQELLKEPHAARDPFRWSWGICRRPLRLFGRRRPLPRVW